MDGIAVEHIEVKFSRLVEDIVDTVTREHEEWTIAQVKGINERIDALAALVASLKPPPSVTTVVDAARFEASGRIRDTYLSKQRRELVNAVKAWLAESGHTSVSGSIGTLMARGVFGKTTKTAKHVGTIMRKAADPSDFGGLNVANSFDRGSLRWTFSMSAIPAEENADIANMDARRNDALVAWLRSRGGAVVGIEAHYIRLGIIETGLWQGLEWRNGHSVATHLRRLVGDDAAPIIVTQRKPNERCRNPQWTLRLRSAG